MVFSINIADASRMLGASLPQILVGQKKSDPTMWRNLSDLESGKTRSISAKTLSKILYLVAHKANGKSPPEILFHAIINSAKSVKQTDSIRFLIQAASSSHRAACGEPLQLLENEATVLETHAKAARQALRQGSLENALEHIRGGMPEFPCMQSILGQTDSTGTAEQFATTALPLQIVTTLYLTACADIELFGPDCGFSLNVYPIERDGKQIRPMTRWLEGMKMKMGKSSVSEFYDLIVPPTANPENTRREVRKWINQGEIPAWSRVDRIVQSVADATGQKQEDVAWNLFPRFCIIRILDGLLGYSFAIRDKYLPEYDPFLPFRDFPIMFERAQAKYAALSPVAKR